MQRGHSPQTVPSEHSQIWPQRGDPGLLSRLFPKAQSGWVNGELLRDVGQAWDAGVNQQDGPGWRSLPGCAQLCPHCTLQPLLPCSQTAHSAPPKPPRL